MKLKRYEKLCNRLADVDLDLRTLYLTRESRWELSNDIIHYNADTTGRYPCHTETGNLVVVITNPATLGLVDVEASYKGTDWVSAVVAAKESDDTGNGSWRLAR